jgi:NADPH:quinone reductase-like Zn-dependent oxidoreductase
VGVGIPSAEGEVGGPAIDTRYPMAELHAALDHLDRGAFGKVVVEFG